MNFFEKKMKSTNNIEEAPFVDSPEALLKQMFRLRGTVLIRVWWQTIAMGVYSAMVIYIHNYVLRMTFGLSLVPVLGVVTGLLLVFRTNTAYDRYWEGRRLWSHMTYQIRSLTMSIWVGIDDKDNPVDIIEKTSAINLLMAFAFATKNYLRGEYSYDEEDMRDLINHLPKFQTPSSNKPLSTQGSFRRKSGTMDPTTCTTKTMMNSPNNSGSTTILFPESQQSKSVDTKGLPPSSEKKFPPKRCFSLRAFDQVTPSNIPLEISYYLFAYLKGVSTKGYCDANIMRTMQASVMSLLECLTGFERILRTPMPMAYRLHLHFVVWLYLLALPYQLVMTLNWFTLPASTLASVALLGILGIGGEIENPFGYDDNDLPLDDFCQVMKREIQKILAHPMQQLSVGSWVMTTENHPFAPASWSSAPELLNKSGDELRSLLTRRAEVIDSSYL